VSWRVIALDEIEALPGPGTLAWQPVRATLGIRAFGTNAYTADEAGQDVVEPHTEGSDHEELYFVARGRARFTLDGEQVDAPAGTYVFVDDPAVHRHAVALEPGTTVLSFGGPPTFTPSAWEWAFRANSMRAEDPARTREILEDGLRTHPDSATLRFDLACLDALQGRVPEALDGLRDALARRPGLREAAREDPDFAALRDDPRFRELTGA
jgi:hypothetical protein